MQIPRLGGSELGANQQPDDIKKANSEVRAQYAAMQLTPGFAKTLTDKLVAAWQAPEPMTDEQHAVKREAMQKELVSRFGADGARE